MKEKTIKLLPCPLCGCKGICVHSEETALGQHWVVHCQDCSCSVSDRYEEVARTAWNTRKDNTHDARLELVKESKRKCKINRDNWKAKALDAQARLEEATKLLQVGRVGFMNRLDEAEWLASVSVWLNDIQLERR